VNPDRLPRVSVAQRVIDKIVANALIYDTETGEVLFGFTLPSAERAEPDMIVLDTIPPDDSAIRLGAMFEQGDEWQNAIFNWYEDNWRLCLQRGLDAAGKPIQPTLRTSLTHLGNWHKHPGTYTIPSEGDLATALDDLADPEMGAPQLLVFLATVWEKLPEMPPLEELLGEDDTNEEEEPSPTLLNRLSSRLHTLRERFANDYDDEFDAHGEPEAGDWLIIPINDTRWVRIDFWYISRTIRRFVRVHPLVLPNESLPVLNSIGWHLANPERVRLERDTLRAQKFTPDFKQYDTDGVPPLEICSWVWRPPSPYILFLVTDADYPARRPLVRITPVALLKALANEPELFRKLWEASKPVPASAYPTWAWTPERTLADLAAAVEANLLEGKMA